MSEHALIPVEVIERRIYLIRGAKVMLDADLAELYQVKTFRLNEQVKRNRSRFPKDFVFQLTKEESRSLTSQFARSKKGRGGRRTLPYAFTEQGVAMLSSVLNSDRAIRVNIAIMRAFVKLRQMLSAHREVLEKLDQLERKYQRHDTQIKVIFDAIRRLVEAPSRPKSRIGFAPPKSAK